MVYTAPTVTDVRRSVPIELNVEDDKIQALIELAERRLRQTLLARGVMFDVLSEDADRAEFLRDMLVEAVARVVRNPAAAAGFRSESEGNYSYSLSSALDAAANIWFPDKDLDLLVPRPARRYGTVTLARPARNW